jgi:DNA-binding CsgD family transcriptional regulator
MLKGRRFSLPEQPLDPSPTQLMVLDGFARGKSRDEVADELGITLETVKTHTKHAQQRLRAKNRTHAVAIAIRRGLL